MAVATTCAGASARIHIPLEREIRLKSILAILVITLVSAQLASAGTEVSQHDTRSEDLASAALIGANLALAAQLGPSHGAVGTSCRAPCRSPRW